MIVALIGFMASGKSTFGRAAAERLGWRFEDLDDLVMPGRSAGEALRALGADAFRESESAALREVLASGGDMVLALGGGTPLREENRSLLRSHCCTIWIRTSMDIIWSEIGNSDRPLAEGLTYEALEELYKSRMPAYEAASDFIFPVEAPDPERVAEDLASCIKTLANYTSDSPASQDCVAETSLRSSLPQAGPSRLRAAGGTVSVNTYPASADGLSGV